MTTTLRATKWAERYRSVWAALDLPATARGREALYSDLFGLHVELVEALARVEFREHDLERPDLAFALLAVKQAKGGAS